MASTAVAQEYWGYLIKPDKSPTPVFEQLLLGVADYIVSALLTYLSDRVGRNTNHDRYRRKNK